MGLTKMQRGGGLRAVLAALTLLAFPSLVGLVAAAPARAEVFAPVTFEDPEPPAAGEHENNFASSTALSADGTIAVASAPTTGAHLEGVVYVFVKTDAAWTLATRLKKPGTEDFGASVSISGDGRTVLATAPQGGYTVERGYVFAEPTDGWVGTAEVHPSAELVATNSNGQPEGKLETNGVSGPGFGPTRSAISADASTVIIGAPYYGTPETNGREGVAFIFAEPGGGWSGSITQSSRLVPLRPVARNADFGWSVALSAAGNTAIVGEPSTNNYGHGAADLFTAPSGGWESAPYPVASHELTGPGERTSEYFGYSVALSASGTTAAVGAFVGGPQQEVNQITRGPGRAYVFTYEAEQWSSGTALAPPEPAEPEDDFGWSVALAPDASSVLIAAVGHRAYGYWSAGAVYQFEPAESDWRLSNELTPPEATPPYTDEALLFGYHLFLAHNPAGGYFDLVSTPFTGRKEEGTTTSFGRFSRALSAQFGATETEPSGKALLYPVTQSPSVETVLPLKGAPGTKVTIKGLRLAKATSVTFNGIPAPVSTDTYYKLVVTVPQRATSGPITITTPGGTGESAESFTVPAEPVFYGKAILGGTVGPVPYLASGSASVLETQASRTTIDCKGAVASGAVTDAKTMTALIRLTGCELAGRGLPCENAAAREVATRGLVAELGSLTTTLPGLRVGAADSGDFADFSCGGGEHPTLVRLTGSVIASIGGASGETVELAKFPTALKLAWQQTAGVQNYTHFLTNGSGQLTASLSEWDNGQQKYVSHTERLGITCAVAITTTPTGQIGVTK